jgi:ABC-type amino acid transport substrate-binding protein
MIQIHDSGDSFGVAEVLGLDPTAGDAHAPALQAALLLEQENARPKPPFAIVPAAYQLPLGETEWRAVINAWIALKRTDGTLQKLFDYWTLGLEAEVQEPRWSVARDVPYWTE